MSKIRTIEVSYGRTVNLGNYESARFDIRISADVMDEDKPSNVLEFLKRTAIAEVLKQIKSED